MGTKTPNKKKKIEEEEKLKGEIEIKGMTVPSPFVLE